MTQKRDAFTDVYVAAIPASPEYCPVLPEERQALIEATKHEQVKAQRYCAWIALLTGLKHSLAIDAEAAGLQKNANGKWTSSVCELSLSHCRTAVAAAVSSAPVGVDLEPVEDARYRETLLDRIATEAEREAFRDVGDGRAVPILWTRKEASFKRAGGNAFSPIHEDAADESIVSFRIRLDREYVVSAATDAKRLRVFEIKDGTVTERKDFAVIAPKKPEKPYVVYMLRCAGDRLYTGITTDLFRRFSEHAGSAHGAKFTHAFRPESVAAAWSAESRTDALKLEAGIKKLKRRQKEALIERDALDLLKNAVDPGAYRRIEV